MAQTGKRSLLASGNVPAPTLRAWVASKGYAQIACLRAARNVAESHQQRPSGLLPDVCLGHVSKDQESILELFHVQMDASTAPGKCSYPLAHLPKIHLSFLVHETALVLYSPCAGGGASA